MLWIRHIDATPFRKLGDEENQLSGKQVFLKVRQEIQALPDNASLTKTLCNPFRFCGILVIDGKYIGVKGYKQKIPFIYGIDYLTHDIPLGGLYSAEDEMGFVSFFAKLKELNYPLRAVVADDRSGLKQALLRVFPHARLQLCHTHYLENIRELLHIRTEDQYQDFFYALRRIFRKVRSEERILLELKFLSEKTKSRLLQNILQEVERRKDELLAFRQVQDCPSSTNMIEAYNSHLNGRLKTIKGFQSFVSAKAWLNAYMIRRRTKTLTDCKGQFKNLNGLASLQMTIRDFKDYPTWIAGVKVPKNAPKR